jgi:molybdate transport system ATP-binding protein
MSLRGWIRLHVGAFSLETDWDVAPGSILVLFGPSGSGKTVTLQAIVGLIHPQEGRIAVDDRVLWDSNSKAWTPPHLRHIGYVPQEYHLFPHLTVAENIAYGLYGWNAEERTQRVNELVRTSQLDGLERRRTWELSGGQRQRVALARALAPHPTALLLDEPFSALDIELRRTLRSGLRALLKKARVPVVLVTHDREEALALGDVVHVLDHGRVIARGAPLAVLGHPTQTRVARLVGVENLLQMTVERVDVNGGSMECVSGSVQLSVPLLDAAPGTPITIGIRADDIILASQEPRGLSARNRLRGAVMSVEPIGAGYEVTVDIGLPLRCHVVQGALDELGIARGKSVWAVIKASSCVAVSDEH